MNPETESEKFSVNQIMVDNLMDPIKEKTMRQNDLRYIVYIPAYIKIKIKNFKSLNFDDLNSEVNLQIQITLRLKGICQQLRDRIINNMILQIRRNEAIKIGGSNQLSIEQVDRKGIYYSFIVDRMINTRIQPYVFFTPFEILDLVTSLHLKLQVHSFVGNLAQDNQQKVYVAFNLMDRNIINDKGIQNLISFTSDCSFAQYDLAQKRVHIELTDKQSPQSLINLKKNIYNCKFLTKKIEDDLNQRQKIGYRGVPQVSFAHFHVPLYRFPASTFSIIFIPLWILGILNLSVFYAQDEQFSVKIGDVATILLAYFTLINVIRNYIIERPFLTMMEIIVNIEMITPFFVIIQALDDRNDENKFQINYLFYSFVTYELSLIITMLVIILPIIGYFIYALYLYPRHNRAVSKRSPKKDWDNNQMWIQTPEIQNAYAKYRRERPRNKFICEKQDETEYKKVMHQISKLVFIDQ